MNGMARCKRERPTNEEADDEVDEKAQLERSGSNDCAIKLETIRLKHDGLNSQADEKASA